jgi:hypothetical protein
MREPFSRPATLPKPLTAEETADKFGVSHKVLEDARDVMLRTLSLRHGGLSAEEVAAVRRALENLGGSKARAAGKSASKSKATKAATTKVALKKAAPKKRARARR